MERAYRDPVFLHFLYGCRIGEPAAWVVPVGVGAETGLVTVDEPGVDAQDCLGWNKVGQRVRRLRGM